MELLFHNVSHGHAYSQANEEVESSEDEGRSVQKRPLSMELVKDKEKRTLSGDVDVKNYD